MPRQDRMSLQTVQFNPTPFQAVTFTPQAADASILQRSLAQQEERENAAVDSMKETLKTFGTIRSQMHQDTNTMSWFDKFRNDKMGRLYNLRNLDPDRARKEAELLAVEVVDDPELQGRIRNNEQITKAIKGIEDNKNISAIRKKRFIEKYNATFSSEPDIDPQTGKVIGTKEWTPQESPVETVNRIELVNLAKSLAAPTKGSTETFSQTGHTKADKSSSSGFSGSSTNRVTLTEEKLDEVLKGIEKVYPTAGTDLLQEYDDLWYEYNDLTQQLATATEEYKRKGISDRIAAIEEDLKDENGVIRTPREFEAYRLDFIIPNMAYDYIDTSKKYGKETAEAPANGLGGAGAMSMADYATFMAEFNGGTESGSTVYMNYGLYGGNAVANSTGAAQAVIEMLKSGAISEYKDARGNIWVYDPVTRSPRKK